MNRRVERRDCGSAVMLPFYRGRLNILVSNEGVCGCRYEPDKDEQVEQVRRPKSSAGTAMPKRVWTEMNEYLRGARQEFTVPLVLQGTEFQKNVWRALVRIPYGETRSYGEIAVGLDAPKASRAVGNAVGANLYLLFVPCHRVIRSNGDLGGFGCGIDVKKFILKGEGIAMAE